MSRRPIYGIVVCGGASKRMGSDKSLLNYHGLPQRYHLYQMLLPLCDRVFISCNAAQAIDIPDSFEKIIDSPQYEGRGPLTALLTAIEKLNNCSFLLIGCDYPYLTADAITALLKASLDTGKTVAYWQDTSQLYEPLVSHYQQDAVKYINEQDNSKIHSLQQLLRHINAGKLEPKSPHILESIDTPEAYQNALLNIQNKRYV